MDEHVPATEESSKEQERGAEAVVEPGGAEMGGSDDREEAAEPRAQEMDSMKDSEEARAAAHSDRYCVVCTMLVVSCASVSRYVRTIRMRRCLHMQ